MSDRGIEGNRCFFVDFTLKVRGVSGFWSKAAVTIKSIISSPPLSDNHAGDGSETAKNEYHRLDAY